MSKQFIEKYRSFFNVARESGVDLLHFKAEGDI